MSEAFRAVEKMLVIPEMIIKQIRKDWVLFIIIKEGKNQRLKRVYESPSKLLVENYQKDTYGER